MKSVDLAQVERFASDLAYTIDFQTGKFRWLQALNRTQIAVRGPKCGHEFAVRCSDGFGLAKFIRISPGFGLLFAPAVCDLVEL